MLQLLKIKIPVKKEQNDRSTTGRGLAWRLIVPIPLALIVAIVLAWIVIPRVIASNATSEAIRASEQVVAQFKLIRAYYTENVVNKLVRDGTIRPAIEHKSNDKQVPLPATMIHDLSALLAEKDTTVNLYSKYPFPNRANRQLDAFQSEAWDYLTRIRVPRSRATKFATDDRWFASRWPTPWPCRLASIATTPTPSLPKRTGFSATSGVCSR